MAATLEELLEVLTLEQVEDDIFRGTSPRTARQRVFGGQVLGQALMAAGRSVAADRTVHSLHAYFLRLGDPTVPIAYVVERVREGRSFSTRRVVARQHGRPIFHLSASFQIEEPGLDHQDPAPVVPPPDSLPTMLAVADADERGHGAEDPREWAALDVRLVLPHDAGPVPHAHVQPGLRVWLRAAGELPDDPLLHAAVLAYASDLTLLSVTAAPHHRTLSELGTVFTASLDHAMWFHRPFRADAWLLHDEISPSASNARGSGHGRVYDQGGRLVATTVQEGVIRLPGGAT